MEEKNIIQARAVYKTLCAMLDEDDWHYDADAENLTVKCSARGEDLPIDIRIIIDPDLLVIILLSELPFSVAKEKRDVMAVAVAGANYRLADGSFDYNYAGGNITFRLTSSFNNSLISKELIKYMVYVSCATVDEFNDKFYDITRREMTLEEAHKYVKGDN